MNPLIIFALMLALTVHPQTVKPGEDLTVSLYGNGTYILEVSDPNIYFNESLTNKIIATPGVYELKVGFKTTSGMKSIFVRYENGSYAGRKDFLVLPISEADLSKLIESASRLEKEIISARKQIILLKEEIKQKEIEIDKLKNQPQAVDSDKIKKLEAQLDELRSELLTKENKASELKIKVLELNSTISSLQDQIKKLQAEKADLESEISILGSPEFVEATKLGFFFIVAFTAGILISLLRR